MPAITLKAHFDGARIQLDETFDLPLNAPLMITVLPFVEDEREPWHAAAAQSLARAYGANEPEYSAADLKP